MAKYEQYAEYKDSEVEWLGKLPKHWKVWKLNHFAPIITCGVASTPEYVDEGVIFLSAQNVKHGKVDLSKGHKFISQKSHMELTKNRMPRKNDILLSRVGTVGEACIVDVDFEFSIFVSLTHLRLNNLVCGNDFFVYLCSSKYVRSLHKAVTLVGGGVGNLNVNDLREYKLPLPTIEEQALIANFLDHETGQIDSLIEKQQTLIQLLKEKRQAVISHAVTKGLKPDAPMKNSGVEWLGEVPEHWEVSKLKYYSSIQGGYAFSSDSFTEEGVQILKIGNVYQNRLALERQPTFVPEVMLEALPDFIVKDGDILMSLTGTLGKRDYGFAVAIKDDGKYLLNQRVAKLNPADEKIDRDFLLNVLWSESYLNQLYSLPSGTKQANLSNSDVLDIVITLPPSKTEQKEIAVELQNQKDIFDKAIQKAMTSIELMQERRTALISAAVTGKIDVRGWQAPESKTTLESL